MNVASLNFIPELKFKAVRSGGKGGQNVNKVSSKVELYFNIDDSKLLNDEQKAVLKLKLAARLNSENVLRIAVQTDRSQHRNKEIAIQQFYVLINDCFRKKKKRVKTSVSKKEKEKRLQSKKMKSDKKKSRKKLAI